MYVPDPAATSTCGARALGGTLDFDLCQAGGGGGGARGGRTDTHDAYVGIPRR